MNWFYIQHDTVQYIENLELQKLLVKAEGYYIFLVFLSLLREIDSSLLKQTFMSGCFVLTFNRQRSDFVNMNLKIT